jgi:hypothetical protein
MHRLCMHCCSLNYFAESSDIKGIALAPFVARGLPEQLSLLGDCPRIFCHSGIADDRSVWGPVDGRSWLWWVIDNVVCTDSWLSIASAGCGLIYVGVGEKWARKVYALQGLRGVERQVGLTWGTRWPVGSSAGRVVARRTWWSRRSEPRRVAAHNRSLHAGFAVVHHKTGRVTWLNHKTKTGDSAGGDGIRARREASIPVGTWRDRRASVGRTRTAEKAWSCDEEECYMTYLPLRGWYLNLSARGSLVIRPTQRNSYIIALGFLGKPSIRTAANFFAP